MKEIPFQTLGFRCGGVFVLGWKLGKWPAANLRIEVEFPKPSFSPMESTNSFEGIQLGEGVAVEGLEMPS